MAKSSWFYAYMIRFDVQQTLHIILFSHWLKWRSHLLDENTLQQTVHLTCVVI